MSARPRGRCRVSLPHGGVRAAVDVAGVTPSAWAAIVAAGGAVRGGVVELPNGCELVEATPGRARWRLPGVLLALPAGARLALDGEVCDARD